MNWFKNNFCTKVTAGSTTGHFAFMNSSRTFLISTKKVLDFITGFVYKMKLLTIHS